MADMPAHSSTTAALTPEEMVQAGEALTDAITAVRRYRATLDEVAVGRAFAEELRRHAVDGAPWARHLVTLGIAGEWPDFSDVLRRNGIEPM